MPPISLQPGHLSLSPPLPGVLKGPAAQRRSQAPSSVENGAPPSFHAEAAATAAPGCSRVLFCPGLRARGPDLGRAWGARRDRGRMEGAGTRRAALKRRGWPGPAAFVRSLWLGAVAARYKGTAGPAGGRRSLAQRGQPSVKGIVLAPQSRARPFGAKLRAPCRAQAYSCSTSAPELGARLALVVPLHPRLRSRAARAAGQFVL